MNRVRSGRAQSPGPVHDADESLPQNGSSSQHNIRCKLHKMRPFALRRLYTSASCVLVSLRLKTDTIEAGEHPVQCYPESESTRSSTVIARTPRTPAVPRSRLRCSVNALAS